MASFFSPCSEVRVVSTLNDLFNIIWRGKDDLIIFHLAYSR